MFKVTLRKEYSTWYWYTQNPSGGGFGSNLRGSQKSALYQALRGLPPGTQYHLWINDRDHGTFTI
ncbi:MAG: hypothetical protein PHU85_00395 [Phycisphaerae bacterium]|nr:hypothetical protein [Phycisphaerae bacterium]